MFCNNCKKEINDNAKFCPECGEKVKITIFKDITEEVDESKMNPFCIAGIILVVLMFFFNYVNL